MALLTVTASSASPTAAAGVTGFARIIVRDRRPISLVIP
jgi:hypothetical protein